MRRNLEGVKPLRHVRGEGREERREREEKKKKKKRKKKKKKRKRKRKYLPIVESCGRSSTLSHSLLCSHKNKETDEQGARHF